jgi:hypothetical protein
MSLTIQAKNGKLLYAVAVEKFDGREWQADIRYLHASSQGEARTMFTAGHSDELIGRWPHLVATMKVVSIAPAIGVFEEADGTITV